MHQILLIAFIVFFWDILTSSNPFFRSANPTIILFSQLPVLVDQGHKGIVVDVLSGDTVRLSTGEVVRYIGIKSPSVTSDGTEECYGQNAKEANRMIVLGKEVILKKDKQDKDASGYLWRYVYIEGVFVNEALVRGGFAKVSSTAPNTQNELEILKAETESKYENKGLWRYCTSYE